MASSGAKEISNEIHELSIQVKNIFVSPSSNEDEQNKWSILKEYQNKYLKNGDLNVNLMSGYHSVAFSLLESLKPTLFSEKWQEETFDNIFLHGIHHEAFMVLVRKLEVSLESYQQQKIVELLEKFLHKKSIDSLLLCQCLSSGTWDPKYVAVSQIWNDLTSFIGSLPERVANKTKGCMPKIFHAKHYVPLLVSSLLRVLSLLHQRITEDQNCTLEFLGKIVGKFCTLGYGETIAKRFCLELIRRSESDFIWRRLSQNLITKLPFNALEPFITNLLLCVPWYGYVDWILGDEVIKNQKLNYIMTIKLIHIRHFQKVIILQNIIGYFACTDNRESVFRTIFISLIKAWSDESALRHQNFEQQKYLASALIIGSVWLKKMKDISDVKAHVDKVLHGTMIRVGSSEECVRSLGMIVSDLLMTAINPDMPKMECENVVNHKLLTELKNLAVIPTDPGKDSLHMEDLDCFEEIEIEKSKKGIKKGPSSKILEIESDDDLEPYDLSKDKPLKQTKRPFYLNDCLQGLIEQENADWFEQCLKYAETLIEANSDTVHEVAVDMAKIMLHMEDKFSMDDFQNLRHSILISLTVHCPILVADYLTSQFYERDYNIRQRLDILEVLSAASQQLSQPKSALKKTEIPVWHCKEKSATSTEKMWKTIVEERIAAKTRHISKTVRQPVPEMVENRFATVAGYFFYPLLSRYDKKNKTLQLLDEDSYVLGRLTFTLGTVMYAASNIPACKNMGLILLQFLVDVRSHTDVFVREAALFAVAAIFTSVPGYLLFSEDMTAHVIESQHWLQSVIERDPETNCQVRASYILSMIMGIMKKEMPLICDILATEENT